jgi:hypothetical protein
VSLSCFETRFATFFFSSIISVLDEADLLKYVRHYRRVDCPTPNNDFMPMISQLPSGEIMVGIPHRGKFRSGIKCMGRELSGTLRQKGKRTVSEIGDWFEVSINWKVLTRF